MMMLGSQDRREEGGASHAQHIDLPDASIFTMALVKTTPRVSCAAIDEIFTEDGVFYDPTRRGPSAATRSIALRGAIRADYSP